jgi:hypothetical protein
VYYELFYHIMPRSLETKLCIYFGFIKTLVDFLCQFYTLWLAVLIKQILKDPIHRLNRYIIFYHVLTVLICLLLAAYVQTINGFGVEVSLVRYSMIQCYNTISIFQDSRRNLSGIITHINAASNILYRKHFNAESCTHQVLMMSTFCFYPSYWCPSMSI